MKSYMLQADMRGGLPPRNRQADAVSPLVRFAALALFALNVLISVAIVRWQIGGIPVRSFFAVAALGLLLVAAPGAVIGAIRERSQVLLLILGFAILGAAVTRLYGDTWALAGRQLLEIHVQAALGFILAIVIVRLCGLRWTVGIFVGAILLTAFFALLQYIHIDFAWKARAILGKIEADPLSAQLAYTRRDRALGLSYSPVHVGTQACLAFCAFYALRLYERTLKGQKGLDFAVLFAVVIMVAACFITGNRSPILGAVAFLAVYFLIVAPRFFWVVAPIGVVMIPAVMAGLEVLARQGVRVASTEDGSALGRAVLADFGWRLFMARPIGYGLGFDSTEHYNEFSQYLLYFANPEQARLYPPHNYLLNMLNKYGVGMALLLPLMIPRRTAVYAAAIPFAAYLMHILFHNDGPFQADFLIWYVFAMFDPVLNLAPAKAAIVRAPGAWRVWGQRMRGAAPSAPNASAPSPSAHVQP